MTYYKAVNLNRTSHYDNTTLWRVGRIVRVANPDPTEKGACGRGLHVSPTLLDAVVFQNCPSRYFEVEPLDIICADDRKSRCSAVRVLRELEPVEIDEIAGFSLYEANHPWNPLLRKWTNPIRGRCRDLPAKTVLARSTQQRLLREWDSVWASVWDSVVASVGASVWDSVRASVWDSVGASVGDSVVDSVGDSVVDSVWASVRAYICGLFPTIRRWEYAAQLGPDPWRPLLRLWYAGYVPSFDGTVWRLHRGEKARIVLEWTPK